jgi:hypothetical protein
MFPFKTNSQIINSHLNDEEIKSLLEKHINKKHVIQITNDSKFYGDIYSGFSKFELGQFPNRNAFRPIAVIKWYKKDLITEINSYIRLDNRITISVLLLPVFGIYLTIDQHIILPFIISLLFALLLIFGLFQLFYNFSKKATLKELDKILQELSISTSARL